MFGAFVWNTWLELFRTCMEFMFGLGIFQPNFLSICRLGKTLTYKCVIWLFCLIGVLNEGKICIEKMLSFRGDVIRFFLNPYFCFGHHSSKLSDSNLWVN